MHNIEYYVYDENVKRDWVESELNHYVEAETYGEGGHGLDGGIRWITAAGIYADEETARRMIKGLDKGWYDNLAVRFYEPVHGFKSKKLDELRAKEHDALSALRAKDCVWAAGLKAEYVSCKSCGSKLKRDLLSTNYCPLCRADLRPESTLKAVEAAKLRYKKAQAACNSYVCDHAKKTVKWLVKIEYHT